MTFIWKILEGLASKMKVLGALGLVGMTVLTCSDVVGRFFRHPVFGSVELVTFLNVIAVAAALPFVHMNSGHIGVEILFRFFSEKTRALIDTLTGVLTLSLYGIVSWQMFVYAAEMKASGEVSMNLQLPEYLVIYIVAVCFVIFFVAISKSIWDKLHQIKGKE